MKIKRPEGRTFKAINLSLDWGIIQRFIDSQSSAQCGAGEVSNIFISVLSPVPRLSITRMSHRVTFSGMSPRDQPQVSHLDIW